MQNNNNEEELYLNQAKNILINTIDPNISLHAVRVLNQNQCSLYECDLIYLHVKIMFDSPNDVDNFLEEYTNLHGVYATQMFVNHPLTEHNTNNCVLPIEAAMLWCSNAEMVRVLYKWGANPMITDPDVLNHFPNVNMPSYHNYLSRYELIENRNTINYPPLSGRRIRNEFYYPIRENVYLTNSTLSDNNEWQIPERVSIPNHQLNLV